MSLDVCALKVRTKLFNEDFINIAKNIDAEGKFI